MLPRNVVVSLEASLHHIMAAFWANPSFHHILSLVIQHCGKFGINLRPQTQASVEGLNQAELCQAVFEIPAKESNSKDVPDGSKKNYDNTNSSSNGNSINCKSGSIKSIHIIRGNSLTGPHLVESVNVPNQQSRNEGFGNCNVENNENHDEPVQGLVLGGTAYPMPKQGEMPLPQTPRSPPPLSSLELVDDHEKPIQTNSEIIALNRSFHPNNNKQVTDGKEYQYQQQTVAESSSNQQPLEFSSSSGSVDKKCSNTDLRNNTFDLKDLLLTPESTSTVLSSHEKKTEQDFTTNSGIVEPKSFYAKHSDMIEQDLHFNVWRSKLEHYSDLPSKDLSNQSKIVYKDKKPGNVEYPLFCVVKKRNKDFSKVASNKVFERDAQYKNKRSEFPLSSCDTTNGSVVEDNTGFSRPRMFTQDFHNSSSVTCSLQKEEFHNCPKTNTECHQTDRRGENRQYCEQSHFSSQFSHLSLPYKTQAQSSSLPQFDATTYIAIEDNLGDSKPHEVSWVSEQGYKTSTYVTVSHQKEQLNSCPRMKRTRCHQTNRSWKNQQDYEPRHFSAQSLYSSWVPCKSQQNQW